MTDLADSGSASGFRTWLRWREVDRRVYLLRTSWWFDDGGGVTDFWVCRWWFARLCGAVGGGLWWRRLYMDSSVDYVCFGGHC